MSLIHCCNFYIYSFSFVKAQTIEMFSYSFIYILYLLKTYKGINYSRDKNTTRFIRLTTTNFKTKLETFSYMKLNLQAALWFLNSPMC